MKTKDIIIQKSNDLIHAKYNLSLNQQRLFLKLLAMIKEDQVVYKIEFKDLAETFGIKHNSLYDDFRDKAETLNNLSLVIYPDAEEKLRVKTNFFKEVITTENRSYLKIEVSQYLLPFLINIKKDYTLFKLKYTLSLRSGYAVRLYEIFKSLAFKKQPIEIELAGIKEILNIEYKLYGHFKSRILKPALSEINKHTDLKVDMSEKKLGYKVTSLIFNIQSQSPNEPLILLEPKNKISSDVVDLYEHVDAVNAEKIEKNYSIEYIKANIIHAKKYHKESKGTLGGFIMSCIKKDSAGFEKMKTLKENKQFEEKLRIEQEKEKFLAIKKQEEEDKRILNQLSDEEFRSLYQQAQKKVKEQTGSKFFSETMQDVLIRMEMIKVKKGE